MYQAISRAGRFCAELGVSVTSSLRPTLKIAALRSAIGAAVTLASACAETTPALGHADPAQVEPALTRLTYAPRHGHTLHLADRLALFDKVGFSSPSAIVHDPVHDVYWVSNLNLDGPAGAGFISRLQPDGALSTLNFIGP